MLGRLATLHMKPKEDQVHCVTECEAEIYLTEVSKVSAKKQGTRSVSWITDQGCGTVNLSETLIAPHTSTSVAIGAGLGAREQ